MEIKENENYTTLKQVFIFKIKSKNKIFNRDVYVGA